MNDVVHRMEFERDVAHRAAGWRSNVAKAVVVLEERHIGSLQLGMLRRSQKQLRAVHNSYDFRNMLESAYAVTIPIRPIVAPSQDFAENRNQMAQLSGLHPRQIKELAGLAVEHLFGYANHAFRGIDALLFIDCDHAGELVVPDSRQVLLNVFS